MKKQIITLAIAALIAGSCFGQTNSKQIDDMKETMYRRIEITGLGYQIDPDEQVIYKKQRFPDGEAGDAYEWVPSDIDFNTTSLIFAGNIIRFKESFPIPAEYIPSLKVIRNSISYDNNYTTMLSPLENARYEKYSNGYIDRFDISGYTYIGQMIFKNKDGELFYRYDGSGLHKITIPLDEASLQFVFSHDYVGAFYTDKNGLYFLHKDRESLQLESSNGKSVEAVAHERYLIYGDAAYPYGDNFYERDRKAMRLNENELYVFPINWGEQYLGDNNKLFVLPSSFNTRVTSTSLDKIIQKGRPPEPVSEWNWFDFFVVGSGNLKNNTVYYPGKDMGIIGSYYHLIKTSSGFYGVTGSSMTRRAVKFDNVMIFNIEKGDYEPIEVEHFRRLTIHFHIYKNQMYYADSEPVEAEIDLQKLQEIRLHGKATNFYTDGTFLVGGYNLGNMTTERRKGIEWRKFRDPLFRDVDWESLQIVSENVMVDKNNIYQVENSVLEIIPIKDLGLNVIVVPNY